MSILLWNFSYPATGVRFRAIMCPYTGLIQYSKRKLYRNKFVIRTKKLECDQRAVKTLAGSSNHLELSLAHLLQTSPVYYHPSCLTRKQPRAARIRDSVFILPEEMSHHYLSFVLFC